MLFVRYCAKLSKNVCSGQLFCETPKHTAALADDFSCEAHLAFERLLILRCFARCHVLGIGNTPDCGSLNFVERTFTLDTALEIRTSMF